MKVCGFLDEFNKFQFECSSMDTMYGQSQHLQYPCYSLQLTEGAKEALKKDFDEIGVNDYNVTKIQKHQDVDFPEGLNNVSTIADHEHQKISDKFIDYPLNAGVNKDKNADAKVDIAKDDSAKYAHIMEALRMPMLLMRMYMESIIIF